MFKDRHWAVVGRAVAPVDVVVDDNDVPHERVSQTELSKARVIQAEVVPDLVAHRLHDVGSQPLGVLAKVAHERVTENQDLLRHATAAEEAPPARLEADVLAISVVLDPAV